MTALARTSEAIERFNTLHHGEVRTDVLEERGRRLVVSFGGSIAESCCAPDYFDDLAAILEEYHGVKYVAWQCKPLPGLGSGFEVTYARIDFLDEIIRVIGEIRPRVLERISEFEALGRRMEPDEIFSELCFCILTANYTAEGGIRIQRSLGQHFRSKPAREMAECLRSLGHRFPNKRAEFICGARQLCGGILQALGMDDLRAREWLVENVKGLGYKEASHFLRNIGRKNVAIVDRHILRYLQQKGIIDSVPGTLSRKRYIAFERLLSAISAFLGISLAELDLYLWYMMTGKLLK